MCIRDSFLYISVRFPVWSVWPPLPYCKIPSEAHAQFEFLSQTVRDVYKRQVCIHILFIFRFSRQITSCQISCPAITIIKNFLQVFIDVQYLCYITSSRWGCFLGLETVCNLSIACEQASQIISNIAWIINGSPLCQCNCGTAACGSFSRRQYLSLIHI